MYIQACQTAKLLIMRMTLACGLDIKEVNSTKHIKAIFMDGMQVTIGLEEKGFHTLQHGII